MGRTGRPGTSTTPWTGHHICYEAVLRSESTRSAGTGILWDPGRERAAERHGPPAAGPIGTWATGGPRTLRAYASLPEALPAAGTHPGQGRYHAEKKGAADLGAVGDIVTASDL